MSGKGFKKASAVVEDAPQSADFQIDLGGKKRVTVRKFGKAKLVDIREHYQKSEGGEWLPSKKGISLTEDLWNKLVSHIVEINEAIEKLDGGATVASSKGSEQTNKRSRAGEGEGEDDENVSLSKKIKKED
ncbi:hypothetical protein B5S28_g2296 [[Candida] boidinii]|nr:hypothetical protein B5S28_g2296 [[Candida] boidinii]OWB62352.1 hypothetical protein B5S29_g3276 [[Candida] boidinii]OWB71072.1 hypothetical protein B5S31_g755 [[Candida] boidinii]OWB76475.1 hypothetical protein B5S32_g627 [[Candida] boidinii]